MNINVNINFCLLLIFKLCLVIYGNQSNIYYYITTNGSISSAELNSSDTLFPNPNAVAVLLFENNINQTGWANLELRTFPLGTEEDQSYSAGYLEGYVTGGLIAANWRNLWQDFCAKKTTSCPKIRKFLKTNREFVTEMVSKYGKTDQYWREVALIYKQLDGLVDGYRLWQRSVNQSQSGDDDNYLGHIMMLNLEPEINDLSDMFSEESPATPSDGHCSALIKPLADGSDLLVGHNTWSDYNEMLRIVKKYNFSSFRILSHKSQPIAGHSVAFTSYPGVIFSIDDYYALSSGLVVLETSIENQNQSLYKYIQADKIVMEFVRNLVANRLANSGKEWTYIFAQYNSGTYNNQFMIVDYKLFKVGTKPKDLADNLLWIAEQMPGMVSAADVTQVLRSQAYWASYNVAYFGEIFNASAAQPMVNKYGPHYSHNLTARARIFRRDHVNVTDLSSMYKLMRYNDFKSDPLSRCEQYARRCEPSYSADLTIAARSDLNEPNGTYGLHEWRHRGFGATDAKIIGSRMVSNLEMLAVNGPTSEQQPAFQWSNTSVKGVRHDLQPDRFNFAPIYVRWFPNRWQNHTLIK